MSVKLNPEAAYTPQKPLRDGPDISFVPFAHAGDNQGNHGACSVFALVNHVEIMSGRAFSDDYCIELYTDIDNEINEGRREGLRIEDAFNWLKRDGMFDTDAEILPAYSLKALARQPIIAVYEINEGWYSTNAAGNIQEWNRERTGNYHAVLVNSHGHISSMEKRILWAEGSWGLDHGYKGHVCFTEDYHNEMCRELYYIIP